MDGKTFGDFFDVVYQTRIIEGQIWMDDWRNLVSEACWQAFRQMPCNREFIEDFAVDMVTAFQARMTSICTNELYSSTSQAGHAFLQEVKVAAAQFDVDVERMIRTPITPTEAVAHYARRE